MQIPYFCKTIFIKNTSINNKLLINMYENNLEFALNKDRNDSIALYRDKFFMPKQGNGNEFIYFTGNSLGLQPKSVRKYIEQELKDWETMGVEGHFNAKNPWMFYHEFLTDKMARIVGGLPSEVVVMNTLTVNLHLMMVSFYTPTKVKNKILIEKNAFPSDQYAIKSQIEFHGFNPAECLVEIEAKEGETYIRTEDILQLIDKEGDSIALIMLGGVNYYTGQAFDMQAITEAGHKKSCRVGFDLAHGAGNLLLDLHNWNVDFAVWCTYKYLNSGPGGISGCFVHKKHADNSSLPRFAGWWGHNKARRFLMEDEYLPISGAEGWQLSNAPILPMASLLASLDIFDEVGMEKLNKKSSDLTSYLEYLLLEINDRRISIITPSDKNQRGCQLSIRVKDSGKSLFDKITEQGVIADWREPDVIRVAPVPLYNSYTDVFRFVEILSEILENNINSS